MDDKLRKKFIRLIYAKALRYLGIALFVCAVFAALPGGVSGRVSEDISGNAPVDVSENMAEDASENKPEDTSANITEDASENEPEDISVNTPDDNQKNIQTRSLWRRTYFMFSLCAAGGFFLAWGWFTYLASTGMRVPGFGRLPAKGKRVPYMYRKNKSVHHKPAFLMTADDYDDDLNDQVSLSGDDFTTAQQQKILQWARLTCSALLFLISLLL